MKRLIGRNKQYGAALLLFLLIFLVLGISFLLSSINSTQIRVAQEQNTQEALAQAKEAIIGWSVSHKTQPGLLPCPEEISAIGSTLEGSAQGSCKNDKINIGRIPWRTLGLSYLESMNAEPFWYVVSPGFLSAPINANSIGQLKVDGKDNAAVALIIAPGLALPGQNRGVPSKDNPPRFQDYLDLNNALVLEGDTGFITTGPKENFNDHVLVITKQELFKILNKRVLAEVQGLDDQMGKAPIYGLRGYYNVHGQFPWAGDSSGIPVENKSIGYLPYKILLEDVVDPSLNFYSGIHWLTKNAWLPLVKYERISADQVRISLDEVGLDVFPCSVTPCQ